MLPSLPHSWLSAIADVACLRGRIELARSHVLDYPLAQRADGISTPR
jgi:hypothetical protein